MNFGSALRLLGVTCGVALLACMAASAKGRNYPDKPIRLIVAYPPGGGADIVAKALASRMSKDLGWQMVVDNRSSAAGIIGTEAAAKAAPDGYRSGSFE